MPPIFQAKDPQFRGQDFSQFSPFRKTPLPLPMEKPPLPIQQQQIQQQALRQALTARPPRRGGPRGR